jgi:hypothetical protein
LAQIPGVNYNALGKGRSPVIVRGIATISTTILSDAQSTSAIYIDDLPSLQRWGAWTNTDPNTFDVERVEVLRGPQGTLFGSGALGGALRVIQLIEIAKEGVSGNYKDLKKLFDDQYSRSVMLLPHVMRQRILPVIRVEDESVVNAVGVLRGTTIAR